MSLRAKPSAAKAAPAPNLEQVLQISCPPSKQTAANELRLVYATVRTPSEKSWAIQDGKQMYAGAISGDVWDVSDDKILESYPLTKGDIRVQNLLSTFFRGWKDVDYSKHITQTLQSLGYLVP